MFLKTNFVKRPNPTTNWQILGGAQVPLTSQWAHSYSDDEKVKKAGFAWMSQCLGDVLHLSVAELKASVQEMCMFFDEMGGDTIVQI